MPKRRRFYYRLIALLMLAGGILLLDARASDFVGPPAPKHPVTEDPFPIRRVLAPSERIAVELNRGKQGEWQRLPRGEFESLVRAAARGKQHRAESPKLIEAHYRAKLLRDTLENNSLEGTAEWKIVNSGDAPSLLPLDSLGIALTSARWTNNRNAVLGLIEPRSPPGLALLVEQPGEQSLAIEWSSRGVPTPGELRFDLAVPLSPIASLDLELPADLVLVLPQEDTLIEGPFPVGGDAGRQSWRIAFGGLEHLEISLRSRTSASPAASLLTNLSSRFDLSPGAVISQFTFEYRAARTDVSVLTVEYDDDLSPTEVSVLNLESWRTLPADAKGKKHLEIRLREPARGGQLRVTARSTLPVNETGFWTIPTMSIVGGIIRSENLRLRVPPALRLVDSRSGAFRLVRVEQAVGASTLIFEPALVPDGQIALARPSARFQLAGAEYRARQHFVWEVAADRSTLTTSFDLEVQRGAVHQLSLRLPGGAEVERVELEPKELNPTWTVQSGANPLLQIELARPLLPGSEGHLRIQLRVAGAGVSQSLKSMAFPDLVPLGARQRSGDYRVVVDSAFESIAPSSIAEEDLVGPVKPGHGFGASQWVYRFHGQPPAGPLIVSARVPRFAVSVDHIVNLGGSRLETTARLSVQPESGVVNSIVLFSTEPIARPWTWKVIQGANQVVSVDPLHVQEVSSAVGAIGSRLAIGAAARVLNRPPGQWWRISFARPLTGKLILESHSESAAPVANIDSIRKFIRVLADPSAPLVTRTIIAANLVVQSEKLLSAPLLSVLNATRQQRTVKVRVPSSRGNIVAAPGWIRESERLDGFVTETAYRLAEGSASLSIDPNQIGAQSTPLQIDSARLISVADPAGRNRYWFAFRVRGAIAGRMPIGLAAGSEVQSIAVAGRLLNPEQIQMEVTGAETTCAFALPGGDRWHTVEILYSAPAPEWGLTTRLNNSLPRLPTQPGSLRVEWRLPPDVEPINASNWVQLPGGSIRESRKPFPWQTSLFERPAPAFRERTDGAPIAPTPKGVLPRTVYQALLNPGMAAEKPLIDSLALAEAGIKDTTTMPPGGWDALGLTVVSFPGGTVLTTPRQLSIWKASGSTGSVPASIHEALHEAIRNGRDSSGRFRTIADWAETPHGDESPILLTRLGGDEPGWTAWVMRDAVPVDHLSVAHARNVTVVGWLAAALLAAIGILLVGRLGRTGIALLLIWLLAAGIAMQWLPVALRGLAIGPMAAGLLLAFVSIYRRRSRRSSEASTAIIPPSTRRQNLAAPIGVTTTLLLVLTATAGAPEPVTIYLLPGPADDPEPKTVLAPADLIDRLKHTADSRPVVSEYAFLHTDWVGRAGASSADFEGRLVVYSFAERTQIELPLGETRLREALLDGAAAFPKPIGAGRFELQLRGRGEHRIDLKFAASIGGTGPDRETRFSIPESAITHLVFHVPAGGEQPQAINWHGAQQVVGDGNELRADLGRTKAIHVRWRQAGASGKAQARVQEAALWNLNPAAASLHAAFDYKISQGSLQSLKIALPQYVEVSRLEVRPESTPTTVAPSWIRDWSVGPNRVLNVDLQSPLTGSFQLLLEAVPTRPLSIRPSLQFPSVLDVSEREAYLAYRLRGIDASPEMERRGVTDFSTESFLKDVWRPANAEPVSAPVTRAFRRIKNESAFVRPVLKTPAPAAQGSQELIWRLGPRGAELRSIARWTAAEEPLSFVEWELPALVLLNDVRGVNVHSWLRIGNRVQVWLREPAQEATLVWHGILPRAGATAETIIFDLPPVNLTGVRAASTILRVRVPAGWALSTDNFAAIGVPIPPATDREMAGLVAKPSTSVRFILRGPQSDAAFKALTVAEVVERRLRLTTFIQSNLRTDRPHSLVLTLGDASDWEAKLEGPSDSRNAILTDHPRGKAWTIDIPTQDTAAKPIILTISRPLGSLQEVALPMLSLSQGDRLVRIEGTLAVLGPELRTSNSATQVRPAVRPETIFANRPRELAIWRDRGGSLWHDDLSNLRPGLVAAPTPLTSSPNVRMTLIDIEAVQSGGRWIYRAAIDLIHEPAATLECTMPSPGSLRGVALDGMELHPPATGTIFTIALPTDAGARLLQMVWTTQDPIWEPPIFTSGGNRLTGDQVLWTAIASTGDRIEVESAESIALHNLRRADALMRIAADRDPSAWPAESLAMISSRVLRSTRLADAAISGPRSDAFAAERGPNGIALAEWSARLREQALTLRGKRQAPTGSGFIRETTFERLPFADVFRAGTPVRWTPAAQAGPANVQIRVPSSWSPIPALASLGLIALIVALLGFLMLLLSRSTRPEQILVVGLLGAVTFGAPYGFAFLGLVVLALMMRAAWAGRRVYRWLAA